LSIDDHISYADVVTSMFKMQGQAKLQISLFLTKLPLEIRLQIYRLVLGDRYVQILLMRIVLPQSMQELTIAVPWIFLFLILVLRCTEVVHISS
jgi:hypothetical protein